MCRLLTQTEKLNFKEKKPSSYEEKKGLSVHFNTNCNNDVDVTIHEISKLSSNEIESSWYSYDEYQEIKTFFSYVVFAIDMKDGDDNGANYFDSNNKLNIEYNNDVDNTTMGLENETVEGKWERHVHRQDCSYALFDVQDEQEKMKEKTKRIKRLSMNHTNNDTDNNNNEEIEVATKFQSRIAEACKESTAKPTKIAQQKAIKLYNEVLSYNTPTTASVTATTTNENTETSEVKVGNIKNKCDKCEKNLIALCSHWDRQKGNNKDKLINDASTGYKPKANGRTFSRRSSLPTRMNEPMLVVEPSLLEQCVDNSNHNKAEIDHNSSKAKDNQKFTFMDGTENNDFMKKTVCTTTRSNSNKSSASTSRLGVTITTTATQQRSFFICLNSSIIYQQDIISIIFFHKNYKKR